MKIFSIVGSADSGKTTVLENLVAELTARGRKVGVIKHCAEGFEIDRQGTDTFRLKAAGASVTIAASEGRWAAVCDAAGDEPPRALAGRLMTDCHFVVTEGYKSELFPKIEVFRREKAEGLITGKQDRLAAVVTDDEIQTDVPVFGFKETKRLADFVEEKYYNDPAKGSEEVFVNGKKVPIKGFVKDIITQSIFGMLGTLRGVNREDLRDVQILIRSGSGGMADD